ncbi:YCII-related domain protein [mine drainage metagenome]|uniref:YCII-related domain protein n=1 Tax=mine drainage metagenome TaxID=410659 RepID=A0A1J5SPQ4_9ZZZZ
MFVIIVRYKAGLEQIDAALPAHRQWLAEGYAEGAFLLAGPQVPRQGGVILARSGDRAVLEARLALDPFARGGLADYDVIEMRASSTTDALAFLQE